MDDLPSSLDISSDELTWLQASTIFDESPVTLLKDDDDIFMDDLTLSSSSDSFYAPSHFQHAVSTLSSLGSPPSSRDGASFPTPSRGSMRANSSPRSEWIYRRPRSPAKSRHRPAGTTPYPRPSIGCSKQTSIQITPSSPSMSVLTARTATVVSSKTSSLNSETVQSTMTTSTPAFWSTVLRSRPRSERSIPLLKTIPSESQIALSPLDLTPVPKISSPKRMSAPKSLSTRPPSISSTLSSISNSPSPSTSRSESPVAPISLPLAAYGGTDSHRRRRQNSYHQRHRMQSENNLPPMLLSQSCPSKSILARTSSVSTKSSSHTVNKSVKFAANTTVHYASQDYWSAPSIGRQGTGYGNVVVNMDAMHQDENVSAMCPRDDQMEISKLRESQCETPTPEREKIKAKGIKRLITLTRRVEPTTSTDKIFVAAAHKAPASASPRPVISTPYPLGTTRGQAMQSTVSLRATTHQNLKDMPGSAHFPLSEARVGSPSLRPAPSYESFRSSKSAAARSVRSLGSVKSTSSTRGFRAWLGRTVGWTDS